jgi:hypothetical protein
MGAALLALALLAADPSQPAAAGPPPLQIDVKMPDEATGTMHGARRVAISLPGVEPLVFEADPDDEVGETIYNDQIAVSPTRYVAFGWSSTGGSNHTLKAMLLERRAKQLAIVDLLSVTGRRDQMMLVRKTATGARIGIFAPERRTRLDEEVGTEDLWTLFHHLRSLNGAQASHLKTSRVTALTPGDHLYPLVTPQPRLPDRRVIWYDVTARGFAYASRP